MIVGPVGAAVVPQIARAAALQGFAQGGGAAALGASEGVLARGAANAVPGFAGTAARNGISPVAEIASA